MPLIPAGGEACGSRGRGRAARRSRGRAARSVL